jgi:hypothetical protein
MENIFSLVTGFVNKMTGLFLTILSFGVMAEILFGNPVFGFSVISNVMEIIDMLGNNGVVGLIALIVLFQLLEKK